MRIIVSKKGIGNNTECKSIYIVLSKMCIGEKWCWEATEGSLEHIYQDDFNIGLYLIIFEL